MAYFPAVPQEGRDSYGNPVKKLDKKGHQIWSKAVDTNTFKKKARHEALEKKKGKKESKEENRREGIKGYKDND